MTEAAAEIAGQLVYVGMRQTHDPKKPAYAFYPLDQYDGDPLWFDLKGWKATQRPANIGGRYDTTLRIDENQNVFGFKGGLSYAGQIEDRDLVVAWSGIDRTSRNVRDQAMGKARAETQFTSDKVLSEELKRLQEVINKCRTYNEAWAMSEAIQKELMKGWKRR